MAIHRKKHLGQAAVTSAATPSLPEPIASVDEKITQENIQTHGFHKDKNPPVTKRVRWLLATHPLAVAVIVVGFLSLFGVIVLAANASNNQPNNGGDIATAGDDTEVVQTYDYGTDDETVADTSEQAGSESSSGTGTNATDVQSTAKPSTPTKLGLSAQAYEILVSWGKATGATQYEIQLATNSSLLSARQITSGATAAVVPGLSPNTTYFVRIRAVNANGASGWSAVKSIRTAPAPSPQSPQQPLPAKVGAVSAKVNSTASVTVSWGATAHATRYSVIRATNSAMSSGRKEYAATTKRSYTVSDLKSGTKYYFLVRASNSRGYGPNSNAISAKTRIAPTKVRSLSLLANNNITVRLQSVNGASKYQIRYATSSKFSGAKYSTASSTSQTISGLAQNTRYYFSARAIDGSYNTKWSSAVYLTTAVLEFKLKIATYNILGSNDTSTASKYGSTSSRSANEVAAMKSRGVSIFGVQEMRQDQFTQFKSRLGSGWSSYPATYTSSGTLSQRTVYWNNNSFRLASGARVKYPLYSNPDGAMARIKLEHRASGIQFFVYNHQAVAYNGTTFGGYNDSGGALKREATANIIVNNIKSANAGGLPTFVLGDMNSKFFLRSPKDDAYNGKRSRLPYCIMTNGKFMQNAQDTAQGVSGHCPTKTRGTFDQIYSNLARTKILNWYHPTVSNASDRNPVIVNAKLSKF